MNVLVDGEVWGYAVSEHCTMSRKEMSPCPTLCPLWKSKKRSCCRRSLNSAISAAAPFTTLTRRCGKPGCRFAQPDSPPHGPNYRLTRYVNRKYVSESFSSPSALHKAQREVAAHHKFRELCRRFVEVNEKICRLRPVEQERRTALAFTHRPAANSRAGRRSPGSRAESFLTCPGSSTAPGPVAACASATPDVAFPSSQQGRPQKLVISRLYSPARQCLCQRFTRDVTIAGA